ncbi:MAG: ethanolamine ammonia-lyase subunit EutC [Longimicrobiales bacterium]
MTEVTQRDAAAPLAAVTPDAWQSLRTVTSARIALGHAGVSLPTAAHLQFQLAHARARDAVMHPLDSAELSLSLAITQRRLTDGPIAPVLSLCSQPTSLDEYLANPRLGALLDDASRRILDESEREADRESALASDGYDVAFVIADGLSAVAVERHAPRTLALVLPALREWCIAPISVVRHGRVAIGDEVGALLRARMCVVLIGERPGLSAPDSMGMYLTWQPRPGRTNAERNCISNVRPDGLGYEAAARRLVWLMNAARRSEMTGVGLKEDAPLLRTDRVRPITAD